jgi:hypothetical protein
VAALVSSALAAAGRTSSTSWFPARGVELIRDTRCWIAAVSCHRDTALLRREHITQEVADPTDLAAEPAPCFLSDLGGSEYGTELAWPNLAEPRRAVGALHQPVWISWLLNLFDDTIERGA